MCLNIRERGGGGDGDEEETLCDCGGALIFCPERIQDADQQSLVVPSVIVL